MTLREAAEAYCTKPIDKGRFAYRQELRYDEARLEDTRELVAERIEDVEEMQGICSETIDLVKEMEELVDDQEALNQRLLPNVGDRSLFVEFDMGAIEALRESENDRARRRQVYVSAGIMTVNEVRREMNLPPLEGRG